jgi:hypothetical protein
VVAGQLLNFRPLGYEPNGRAVQSVRGSLVLRGPVKSAPETILGPFASVADAEQWAQQQPRPDGYCVAQELVTVDEFEGDTTPR